MSTREPWGPVLIEAARRQTERNFDQIVVEVERSYHELNEPRDTGRLLSSLEAQKVSPEDLRFGVDRPPQALYGAYQNEGIGVLGPTGSPVDPGKVMSWLDQFSGIRVFRRQTWTTPDAHSHVGWWDRWRDHDVPAAVRRAWAEKTR